MTAQDDALEQIKIVCEDNAPLTCNHRLALKFVGEVAAAALTAQPQEPQDTSFQARVAKWMLECFGPGIPMDKTERNHRFIEEALELVQSLGATRSECYQLVDYVFNRSIGEPPQEVGGVIVTLAALCCANGIDMGQAGETELARIWTKIETIRAKQAAKPKNSPLPSAELRVNEAIVETERAACAKVARVIAEHEDQEAAATEYNEQYGHDCAKDAALAIEAGILARAEIPIAALSLAPADEWLPIEAAPRNGTIFDVWLGNGEPSEIDFYCTPGTRRSANWHWINGKFRPFAAQILITFVVPTHWRPLPPPPQTEESGVC